MRGLLAVLFVALPATFIAFPATADSITLGQPLEHTLSVCLKKADAIEIVNAEVEKGYEAANVLWMTKDECATVPVVGPTAGDVVHTVSVVRDGKKLTVRVVEIKDAKGVVMGYFMSSLPIVATLEVVPKIKPDPKSLNRS